MSGETIDHGRRVFDLLCNISSEMFSLDLPGASAGRDHELWALGIDSRQRKFRDLLGNIDAKSMTELRDPKWFHDNIAGFRVSAQEVIPLAGKKADIFLINEDFLEEDEAVLAPLLVHEVCHYLVDGEFEVAYAFQPEDDANAKVIVNGYLSDQWHCIDWAKLLAWAARESVTKGDVASVRQFLELAIPERDRRGHWRPDELREPQIVK
jgi:hypothetical protein